MRMYCPYCKKEVFTKREDLNIPLIILLSIFTGGIGTLIYLLIWYNFEENRCVHCKGVCTRLHPIPQEISTIETCNGGCPQQSAGGHAIHQDKNDEGDVNIQLNYCPNCGAELTKKGKNMPRFCQYCGENLTKRYYLSPRKNCSVCHAQIHPEDSGVITCSYCNSTYHYSCVASWLREHNACPLCQNVFVLPGMEVNTN